MVELNNNDIFLFLRLDQLFVLSRFIKYTINLIKRLSIVYKNFF